MGSPKIGTSSPGSMRQNDPRHRRRCLDGVHRLFGEPVEVELGERHPQPAARAGVGQEVLGDPLELLRVAFDRVEHPHLALGEIGRGVEQELDEPPNGGDRRPELVRHGGHDVVLHLGQLAQPVVLLNE